MRVQKTRKAATWSHKPGESGPSHLESHGRGTFPAASEVVTALTSVVRRSEPAKTRWAEERALATMLTSFNAASDSIATKASTGAAFSTTICRRSTTVRRGCWGALSSNRGARVGCMLLRDTDKREGVGHAH